MVWYLVKHRDFTFTLLIFRLVSTAEVIQLRIDGWMNMNGKYVRLWQEVTMMIYFTDLS
jgi:hypothetical protein